MIIYIYIKKTYALLLTSCLLLGKPCICLLNRRPADAEHVKKKQSAWPAENAHHNAAHILNKCQESTKIGALVQLGPAPNLHQKIPM